MAVSVDKQKVIDIALAEIGYLEKASNSQLDDPTANVGSGNWTKYARDLFQAGWYGVFIAKCFENLLGVRGGGDVPIVGRQTEQSVANASADGVGVVPCLAEAFEDEADAAWAGDFCGIHKSPFVVR